MENRSLHRNNVTARALQGQELRYFALLHIFGDGGRGMGGGCGGCGFVCVCVGGGGGGGVGS